MEQPWGRIVPNAPSPLATAKRDLTMAKLLMGATQQAPQNNYLAPIANIASMLAFAEADKGYDAAQTGAQQARLDRFGTALDGLAPELGAERVAALRGMLDPNAEDPVRDVTTLMGAFNNADRTRLLRERETRIARNGGGGGGGGAGGSSSGGTLSASILAEARRLAEANPRYLDMTPDQQLRYIRDLGRQLTRGGAAEVDPDSFFPAEPEEEGGSWGEWWSENAPSWLGGRGGQGANPAPAAETPAAASDPVRGTASALGAPRPPAAPRPAPAPVTPGQSARPAAPSRPSVPAPPRPPAPATSPAGMPRVTGDAEYEALPPGTRFMDPDGNVRVKP